MRLGHVAVLVTLALPSAAAAAFATGQAAAVRIDGDGLACAATVPVALADDGARVRLHVVDAQGCTAFPSAWDGCVRGQGYRLSCRTPSSWLVLTFEDELRVDLFVNGPPHPTWHHLEGRLTTFG